ncbi:hypothetical protein FACS1894199_01790 [Bacteroidia bacterium]|nr:hypothetical protein FACS1894199_01790 [Bacteroidia bacterium]
METISIGLAHPKARRLINDLADLQLIVIEPRKSWKQLLSKLRQHEDEVPSMEEITAEVEIVRKARYNGKT